VIDDTETPDGAQYSGESVATKEPRTPDEFRELPESLGDEAGEWRRDYLRHIGGLFGIALGVVLVQAAATAQSATSSTELRRTCARDLVQWSQELEALSERVNQLEQAARNPNDPTSPTRLSPDAALRREYLHRAIEALERNLPASCREVL
jgi:hypothetical protein